ncbi:hypothetical protein D3C72_2269460 [compost metagenome]
MQVIPKIVHIQLFVKLQIIIKQQHTYIRFKIIAGQIPKTSVITTETNSTTLYCIGVVRVVSAPSLNHMATITLK